MHACTHARRVPHVLTRRCVLAFVVRLLIVAGLVYRDDIEYQGILGKVFFPVRILPL